MLLPTAINKLTRKIPLSFLAIFTALALVSGATLAFLSDTETSTGNLLEAGDLDLGIDNHSYYNGVLNPGTTWRVDYDLSDDPPRQFFNFGDVKPGDWGEDTISLHVKTNDAWLCADVTLTSNNENDLTEPETTDGDDTTGPGAGELAQNINFFWWADDGDNVFEICEEAGPGPQPEAICQNETLLPAGPLGNLDVDETATVALADSQTNIWSPGPNPSPFPGDEVKFLAKAWCFGDTAMIPYVQDGGNQGSGPDIRPVICDGSNLNNITQTDSLTSDISFSAVQSRGNANFVCGQPIPSPSPSANPSANPSPSVSPSPSPSPSAPPVISCEPNDIQFASSDSSNDQGLRKNSSAVLANRSVTSAAYGAPQTSGADSDVGFPLGSFFSLGFPLGGNTASIVYGFASPFYPNPSGPDLQIFEVTGGTYPDEAVKVEASSTALGPWTVLAASAIRDEAIELGILPSAQFVRLTDVSNIAPFEPTADGYDLDAIQTFCKVVD